MYLIILSKCSSKIRTSGIKTSMLFLALPCMYEFAVCNCKIVIAGLQYPKLDILNILKSHFQEHNLEEMEREIHTHLDVICPVLLSHGFLKRQNYFRAVFEKRRMLHRASWNFTHIFHTGINCAWGMCSGALGNLCFSDVTSRGMAQNQLRWSNSDNCYTTAHGQNPSSATQVHRQW